jgi:serine/threonine protein kinase
MLTLPAYIDERYRLDTLIGVGGFCPVFLGRQLSVDRPVAVKMISADSQNPTWIKRFEREAVVLAQLKHNNTVKMFDYGVLHDSICYLVMEYVDGKTLREVLDEEGKLELGRTLNLICGVLESLEEAHSLGVIHRDLKPNNIMLKLDHMHREQVRVLDFGVAGLVPGTKVVKVDGAEITADGFIGTPRYAAPEQLTGLKLTPAADVYAIGLLLWELLLGQPAVPESKVEICLRYHLGKKPWRVPVDARLPSRVVAIIEAALRKDPSERTQSCTEMLDELRAALSSPRGLDEESSEGILHTSAQLMDPNVEGFGISEVSEVKIGEPAPRAATLRGLGNSGLNLSTELSPSMISQRRMAEPSLELPRAPTLRGVNELSADMASSHHGAHNVVETSGPPSQIRSRGPRPAPPTPAPPEPVSWRFSPEMIGLSLVVVVLLGALIWRTQSTPEPVTPQLSSKISPEVAKLLTEPIKRGSDSVVVSPPRPTRDVVFDTLRSEGWSVGKLKASNNLGSVQISSYRIMQEEAEVMLEVVQGVNAGVVEEFLSEDAQTVRLGSTGLRLKGETAAGKRAVPTLIKRLSRLGEAHVRNL